MGGSLETFRRSELHVSDPLYWHPLNQRMAKGLREKREKGKSPKVERAAKRKLRKSQELENDIQNEFRHQFNRALSRILDGEPTPEVIEYVARNIKKYETVIDRFRVNAVNDNDERKRRRVTATIVEFTGQDNTIAKRDVAA